MAIVDSITELVGRTPLVRLGRVAEGSGAQILGKLESMFLPMDLLDRLTVDIKKDFQTYEEIALEWGIDRIMIQGETIDLVVGFDGFVVSAVASFQQDPQPPLGDADLAC